MNTKTNTLKERKVNISSISNVSHQSNMTEKRVKDSNTKDYNINVSIANSLSTSNGSSIESSISIDSNSINMNMNMKNMKNMNGEHLFSK